MDYLTGLVHLERADRVAAVKALAAAAAEGEPEPTAALVQGAVRGAAGGSWFVCIVSPSSFLEKLLMEAPGQVERQRGDFVDGAVHGVL